jgi:hypothetical protein
MVTTQNMQKKIVCITHIVGFVTGWGILTVQDREMYVLGWLTCKIPGKAKKISRRNTWLGALL